MFTEELVLSFGLPDVTQDVDELYLEQAEWWDTGLVTKIDLIKELINGLTEEEIIADVECGTDDEYEYNSTVYAYMTNPSMQYYTGITHGTISGRSVHEVEVTEMVSFSLEDEATTKYPVNSVLSYEWAGQTWGESGQNVSNPTISVDGSSIVLSYPVFGSVKIVYMVIRHSFSVTVPPREDVSENVYHSVVWARWTGGVDMLELEAPNGAEDNYLAGKDCITGGGNTTEPRKYNPPIASPDDDVINIDYCTQQVRNG